MAILSPDPVEKLQGHSDLLEGERVIAAVFGVGRGMAAAADALSPTVTPRPGDDLSGRGTGYSDQLAGAQRGEHPFPRDMGSANGFLGLTDRRLVFGPSWTNWKRPRRLTAAVDRREIVGARYERPLVVVELAGGSAAALHVGRAMHPQRFAEAF